MATFAKIGLNSKVIEVLSVHNNELLDSNGVEQEVNGIDFLTKLTGWAIWKQSFTNSTRKNLAGIGYTYDEDRDAFISKKPYASWILNEDTCLWQSPIGSIPEINSEQQDQNTAGTHKWNYAWNENNQTWDLIDNLNT